jgi:hypothetical protein
MLLALVLVLVLVQVQPRLHRIPMMKMPTEDFAGAPNTGIFR